MAKIKVSFDIGSNSMKVAVAKGTGFRVETVPLPNNLSDEDGVTMPHAFSQFLKRTVKDLRLPKGPAALVLPPRHTICRLVSLPAMNSEQLALNLPYEFADFTQGASDKYFCDYAMCEPVPGDEEGTMTMMAAVAEKKHLEEYIRMFARGGVRLKKLVPQEMALVELCRSQNSNGSADEYCFIDLGHLQTRITVVAGDRVQATSAIAIGGRNFDLAIANHMNVDAFLAGTYKTSGNKSAMETPNLTDLCTQLAVEIRKVVSFYQYSHRPSKLKGMYLLGGGAAMESLRNAIIAETIEESREGEEQGMMLMNPAELLQTSQEQAADGIFAAGAVLGGY